MNLKSGTYDYDGHVAMHPKFCRFAEEDWNAPQSSILLKPKKVIIYIDRWANVFNSLLGHRVSFPL